MQMKVKLTAAAVVIGMLGARPTTSVSVGTRRGGGRGGKVSSADMRHSRAARSWRWIG